MDVSGYVSAQLFKQYVQVIVLVQIGLNFFNPKIPDLCVGSKISCNFFIVEKHKIQLDKGPRH